MADQCNVSQLLTRERVIYPKMMEYFFRGMYALKDIISGMHISTVSPTRMGEQLDLQLSPQKGENLPFS